MTGIEQAVIVRFALSTGGYGSDADRQAVHTLREQLRQAIDEAAVGEFDGTEFGGGEVTLYAYGPDAGNCRKAVASSSSWSRRR